MLLEPALHVFNKKSVAYLHTPFFQQSIDFDDIHGDPLNSIGIGS